jgi:hypothetical protein
VVRRSGWLDVVGSSQITGPVVGQGEGEAGTPDEDSRWWLNAAGAKLIAYYSFSYDYAPEGPGIGPDICTHRWWGAWRWVGPQGQERRWVSVAPASDIIPTANGFLLLGTRIGGYCRGRHAKGLTPGDAPWFFLDGHAKLHRLGWSPVATRRDINVGPVVCARDRNGTATRYCTFDPEKLTLSPLDFLPRDLVPIAIGRHGRIWAKTTEYASDATGGYRLTWTDDNGTSWTSHSIEKYSSCAAGNKTVICDDGGGGRESLSLDGGLTWSTVSTKRLLQGVRLPPRLRAQHALMLYEPVITSTGVLVALVGDYGSAAFAAVRRPPGTDSAVHLIPVRQPKSDLQQFQHLSAAGGLLMLGDPIAPRKTTGKSTWHNHRVWISRDEGNTWQKVVLNP